MRRKTFEIHISVFLIFILSCYTFLRMSFICFCWRDLSLLLSSSCPFNQRNPPLTPLLVLHDYRWCISRFVCHWHDRLGQSPYRNCFVPIILSTCQQRIHPSDIVDYLLSIGEYKWHCRCRSWNYVCDLSSHIILVPRFVFHCCSPMS
jgi:hypothetical protein